MLGDNCGKPMFDSRRAQQAAIRKAVSRGNERAIDSIAAQPVARLVLLRRNRIE
jgi:hypothetical protein